MKLEKLTKETALRLLLEEPYKFGHLLGFTKLTKLHNNWIIEMVRGQSDRTIQAHRGSYKTTCVSIALVIILILLPNKTVAFIRKTGGDVGEIIRQVRKILQDDVTIALSNAIYGTPVRMIEQSRGNITTNFVCNNRGTSQLSGIGTMGSITGKHFDYIFTDDIVNVSDRTSFAERERIKLFYQELQNIKNPGGKIFNTGTPWHVDDAFSLMPAPEKFDCYSTGLLTADQIEYIKSKMTSSLFCANYELRHVAEDDVIFAHAQTGADPVHCEQGISHLDSAYYGEDYTAFTIVTYHDGKWYVFGKVWRKHVDDCADEIEHYHKAFHCGKMYTEINADKGFVANSIRNRGIKVVTYSETMNKYVKITTYLKFEWNNVIFVAGTDQEYIDMILGYNENAMHDDAPDSLASLIRVMWNKRGNKPIDPSKLIFL